MCSPNVEELSVPRRTDRAQPTAGRRHRALLVGVSALALVLTACPPDDPTVEPEQEEEPPVAEDDAPPDEVLEGSLQEVPQLVQEVAPSVVAVEIIVEAQGQAVGGAGSGVIWSDDGTIVTNAHVVVEADDIAVVLADGTRYDAEVTAVDVRTDLAVLDIDAEGLPVATFAAQLPELGELVVAIGNPLGFQNTVTAGIVSGLERSLPPTPEGPVLAGLIQTDAAISSGSSGGALIDANGRVVGINVAAADPPEGGGIVAQGIGFAIPATTVVPTIEQLIETGEVTHAFLGIQGASLTPQLAERFRIDRDEGVIVGQVDPGSPADDAGIQQGDVLIALEGTEIGSLGDLLLTLREFAPGDTVSVTVVRNGEEQTLEATLAEPPEDL
jgi:serine protease Do